MNKEKEKQEITVIETQAVQLSGDPRERLKQGQEAAKVLMSVAQPVMIQGNQYLTIGDWQTIGSFYGLSAGSDEAEPIVIDNVSGFRAKAVVRTSDGTVVSSAIGLCMNEGTWMGREKFAQASMAQTRACSKALRMVVGWVARLGGYKDTPAEEMDFQGGITKDHAESISHNMSETPKNGSKPKDNGFVCPLCAKDVKDCRIETSEGLKNPISSKGKTLPAFRCYDNDDFNNPTCKFASWETDENKAGIVVVIEKAQQSNDYTPEQLSELDFNEQEHKTNEELL